MTVNVGVDTKKAKSIGTLSYELKCYIEVIFLKITLTGRTSLRFHWTILKNILITKTATVTWS
jgi:hypothetical protein